MNTKTNRIPEQTTIAKALASVLLVGGLFAYDVSHADADEAAMAEVRAAMAADPDNAIRTLKAGEAAQERRWAGRMHEVEPDTQMRLNGDTDDAQVLRERGDAARHVRQDVRRRQMFNEMLDDNAPRNQGLSETARAQRDVERLGHRPAELDRLQRSGDYARARRGFDVDAPRSAPSARMSADVSPPGTPRGHLRAGSVARGVAGGMAVGWAADTALGTHVPDAFDAAAWTVGTLQRPQDAPKRVGQLATGAVQFTGQVGTQLMRPDRMTVNLANGGVGLAKTGVHVVTHPHQTVKAVGKTVTNVGCGVGRIFKPRTKC